MAPGVVIPLILMGSALAWISLYFLREGRDLRASGVEARAAIVRRRDGNYRLPTLESTAGQAISLTGQTALAWIVIFTTAIGGLMALSGLFFLATGFTERQPTRFDNRGAARVWMTVSPQHDRIALLEEKSKPAHSRGASGRMVASTKDNGWRMLGWRPDGARIAAVEGGTAQALDAQSLQTAAGEAYTWNPEAPHLPTAGIASRYGMTGGNGQRRPWRKRHHDGQSGHGSPFAGQPGPRPRRCLESRPRTSRLDQ